MSTRASHVGTNMAHGVLNSSSQENAHLTKQKRAGPRGEIELIGLTWVCLQLNGRGGKEKEWTDCVQSDIRTFGIAGDWKAMALNAEVWVETVTEGGRRFMAAWRKEEVDAARHRQEKREATRLGTLLSQTGV